MKDIHPTYYPQATITCACGNSMTAGSTKQAIQVELCSKCHPFYTGAQKIIDSARRVDRFEQRVAKKTTVAATRTASKRVKKAKDVAKRAAKKPKMDEGE